MAPLGFKSGIIYEADIASTNRSKCDKCKDILIKTVFFSASSRRKREVFGGLVEYQEYEEPSVRKKREDGAAVVETEQEIALRSYGSRLRFLVHSP